MSAFLHKLWTWLCVLCVLKVSYALIKHLNKEVLRTWGGINISEHVQYVCRKLGGGDREAE